MVETGKVCINNFGGVAKRQSRGEKWNVQKLLVRGITTRSKWKEGCSYDFHGGFIGGKKCKDKKVLWKNNDPSGGGEGPEWNSVHLVPPGRLRGEKGAAMISKTYVTEPVWKDYFEIEKQGKSPVFKRKTTCLFDRGGVEKLSTSQVCLMKISLGKKEEP